jgi:hypothetical protein
MVSVALLRSAISVKKGADISTHSPSETYSEDTGFIAAPFSAGALLQDLSAPQQFLEKVL